MAEKSTTIQMVFKRALFTMAHELMYIFVPYDPDTKKIDYRRKEELWYKPKVIKGGLPGDIYTTTKHEDGKVSIPFTLTGHFPDEDLAQWRASHDADLAAYREHKAVLKHRSINPMLEALDPIKLAYKKANSRQARAAVLSQAIEYITRPY